MILHKTRIIVADDHKLFRAGFVRLLLSFGNITIAAEAEDAAGTLAAVERAHADLLTLDLAMPGVTGMALVEQVRCLRPCLPILVISMHEELALVRKLLQAGVTGYISKAADPELLLAAIERTRQGGRYLPPAMAEALAFAQETGGEAQKLTPREREVLRLIVDGLSLVEIGRRLGLNPKTVTTHKSNIMHKLGAESNAELFRLALEKRLDE